MIAILVCLAWLVAVALILAFFAFAGEMDEKAEELFRGR